MDTLFGHLLSLSIMPKFSNGPYEFFGEISNESQHTDPTLWMFMSSHQNSIFTLVKQLLVLSPSTKKKTLQWIANCLHANTARGQMWSHMNLNSEPTLNQNSSDAFMINLCGVLVRLCEPLCVPAMKVNYFFYIIYYCNKFMTHFVKICKINVKQRN